MADLLQQLRLSMQKLSSIAGDQQTSGVHVEDLARLYVLALKRAPAGTVFNATSSNDNSARYAMCSHTLTPSLNRLQCHRRRSMVEQSNMYNVNSPLACLHSLLLVSLPAFVCGSDLEMLRT